MLNRMSIYSICLLSTVSLFGKETEKTTLKMTPQEIRWEKGLMRACDEIEKDYAKIFAAHKNLKQAKPAEHSYYLDALKNEIEDAVVGNLLEYKDKSARFLLSLTIEKEEAAKCDRKPLYKFTSLIMPKTIKRLNFEKNRAKKSLMVKRVDTLIQQLLDIKRIISR